jgi:hypothetical protein
MKILNAGIEPPSLTGPDFPRRQLDRLPHLPVNFNEPPRTSLTKSAVSPGIPEFQLRFSARSAEFLESGLWLAVAVAKKKTIGQASSTR